MGGIGEIVTNLFGVLNPKETSSYFNDEKKLSIDRLFNPAFRKAKQDQAARVAKLEKLKAEEEEYRLRENIEGMLTRQAGSIITQGNSPNAARDIMIQRGANPQMAAQASQQFANAAQASSRSADLTGALLAESKGLNYDRLTPEQRSKFKEQGFGLEEGSDNSRAFRQNALSSNVSTQNTFRTQSQKAGLDRGTAQVKANIEVDKQGRIEANSQAFKVGVANNDADQMEAAALRMPLSPEQRQQVAASRAMAPIQRAAILGKVFGNSMERSEEWSKPSNADRMVRKLQNAVDTDAPPAVVFSLKRQLDKELKTGGSATIMTPEGIISVEGSDPAMIAAAVDAPLRRKYIAAGIAAEDTNVLLDEFDAIVAKDPTSVGLAGATRNILGGLADQANDIMGNSGSLQDYLGSMDSSVPAVVRLASGIAFTRAMVEGGRLTDQDIERQMVILTGAKSPFSSTASANRIRANVAGIKRENQRAIDRKDAVVNGSGMLGKAFGGGGGGVGDTIESMLRGGEVTPDLPAQEQTSNNTSGEIAAIDDALSDFAQTDGSYNTEAIRALPEDMRAEIMDLIKRKAELMGFGDGR